VKVHAAVSAEGLPLSLVIGPGNEHDSRRFTDVLDGIRIGTGGRSRTRPREVVDDAAYDERRIRGYLKRRGIRSTIPTNRRNGSGGRRRGRPTRFDESTYRKRGCVERFFGWLKAGFRRLTLRYERLNAVFMGLLSMASFLIYWRKVGGGF
jgi:transposase